jgi:hypothetical protein
VPAPSWHRSKIADIIAAHSQAHLGVIMRFSFFHRLVLAVGLAVLAACTTTPKITSYHDYNPAVNFAGLRTWSFISANPMIVSSSAGAVNPLLENRIMNAVRANMESKGLSYVGDPETADVVVSFTVGARDQIKVDQYPANYRMSYSRYYRNYGFGMSYGTETRVRQYTEGQLAVDIFDVDSRVPAYHGSASTRLTSSDRENPQPLINRVVTEALQGFPPGGDGDTADPLLIPLTQ